MKYIADLHIHSHFSRATSKTLTPEYLDYHAGLKGIKIVGTGDFTHPGWLDELKEKTEPDGNGFFKLKSNYKLESPLGDNDTHFLLTAEISNIYKRGGKVRKVHNVVLVPGFEEAEKINQRLIDLGGNLTSDGRPILGLDSRDLLEIVLECGDNNYFIPAHIWTPWFSMLGSKSGFDSLKECFADLSPHIHTIETGLSTDPPMNWLCSFLDNVTLVSNSDAHSPDRLGRNANVFNTELDYFSLVEALKTGDPRKYHGTIDMFPQEGKYHYDGHRKCNICWDPVETLKHNEICPSCKKPVTVGVMNRVIQLTDREDISARPNKLPFKSIIPLPEILSEIAGVGVKSKKVAEEYSQTIQKLGKELDILLEMPIEEIEKKTSKTLAEAIRRMRSREIIIQEGYDGEYGVIKVFKNGEAKNFEATNALFQIEKPAPPEKRALINFDLKGIQKLIRKKTELKNLAAEKEQKYETQKAQQPTFDNLNAEQFTAVQHIEGPSLIIAGPGTGKTKTLTGKIAWLIGNHHTKPDEILAITFTNKAAGELKERLEAILKNKNQSGEVTVSTFHAFGLAILKDYNAEFNRNANFILVDESLKKEIIKSISKEKGSETKRLSAEISKIKKGSLPENPFFKKYENELQKLNAFDLDDLIEKPVQLLSENKEITKKLRDKYQFIFVDEYQDTNDTQYKLLRLLAPDSNSNLCVVGDANQSIYGFRGANSGYISKFSEDYPKAKIFRLTKSYRCSQTILTASSNVIEQSGLLEGLNEGVQISISEQPSGAAEAEFIARQIVDLVGGVSFFSIDSSVAQGDKNETINSLSDLAVLCRTRNQFEAITKALRDHHVPYQEAGTIPYFKQEPFQSFTDIIGAFLLDSFEQAAPVFKLKKKNISQLQFELVKTQLKKPDVNSFLDFVKKEYFDKEEIQPNEWKRFINLATEKKSVSEFLQFLKLGLGTDAYDKSLEAVSVMTLHASKGLEFECVFIPGCEKGLLPYTLYKNEVDEDEEKRLLYVGMTRAKKLLYLTNAKTRTIRGRKFNLPKSPFLNSIQQELLLQIKNRPPQKEKEQDNQLSLF
ncbi:UvrD-helicase domain-containing protein [Maribellus maritimus]|uniref:UvrD-helicase domain-containing protein n=1 Tax=Maribellus maritimus TaxID=2870838 RepID=UPI001EEA77CF|nr:UvrD-helicase domain-containing protein [Maribellus maritimus]MCG6188155.1 UvrD-helicase domain-containing protein [Maribellus maritimus]